MKIGIDITPLLFEGSGVANYTYNLVKNLLIIDKKNQYRLFFTSWRINKKYHFLDEFRNLGAKIYRLPFPFKFFQIIWEKFNIFPIEMFIGKVDLFYANDFLRSPSKIKTITTIHDLVWKIYPHLHKDFIYKTHENKIRKTIQYKDTVIVDSKTTKDDLIKNYPEIKKNKIYIIYPGISNQFKPKNDINKIKKVFSKYFHSQFLNLNSKFLLYVGALDPRKNLLTAIEIFNDLIKDKRFSDFKFFISGKAGWQKNEIRKKINNLRLTDKIKFIGFIKEEDLPYLYSKASLTIYLSSYEGFGLPPLESLACGTPVLAGNNSSMKETLDSQFLVDVNDKKTILEKMKFFLTDKVKIDSSGVKKRFDWTSKAKEFLQIIERLE